MPKFSKLSIAICLWSLLGVHITFASEINSVTNNSEINFNSDMDQNILLDEEDTSSSKAMKKTKKKLYTEGEVIVVYHKDALDTLDTGDLRTFATKANSVSDIKIKTIHTFNSLSKSTDSTITYLKSDLPTNVLLEKLEKDPRVKSVSPNYIFEVSSMPNDPYLERQWGLEKIEAYSAWDTESNASDVVVAVVDTGIEYEHKDIAGNMWVNQAELTGAPGVDDDGNGYIDDIHGYDFAANSSGDNDSDPSPSGYHGTHCAGIIGAEGDNEVGISGAVPHVKLMAVKASYNGRSLRSSDILESMEYVLNAKQHGVNIVSVNASYGGGGSSEVMKEAIRALGENGIIFCAAAGNNSSDNDQRPHYPASYDLDNIISVAATDKNDNLAYFSCYGAYGVDIAAPGHNIYSTISSGARLIGGVPFVWKDDVESNETNWTTSGTHNSWAITESEASSGTHAWTDSPDGNYIKGTNSYLTYGEDIDLTAYDKKHIGVAFKIKYALGKYAHLDMEMSSDSGTTWSAFEPLIGPKRYTITSSSWTSLAIEIPTQFKTAHFRMRFKFYSSYYEEKDGIYLDDITIGNVSRPNRYNYLSGTSMATPFVAGSIALLAKAFPDENVTQRIDRLLSSTTPLPSLQGKVLVGGQLNLANAINEDLLVRHARIVLEKHYGIHPGDTLEINGTSLGETAGSIAFVADENKKVEANILNWNTQKVTLTVPTLPGKKIVLSTASGAKALNSPIVTAWDHQDDLNGTYRSFRTGTMTGWQDKVYYFGGKHYYRYYDENGTRHSSNDRNATWIYDPSNNLWTQGEDIPTKSIYLHTTAMLDGKAYVIGGEHYGEENASEFVYDFEQDKWDTIAPLPEEARARTRFGNAVVVDGKIYYFSGVSWALDYYKTVNKNLYVYNPQEDLWSDANVTLPVGISAAYAVAHEHKIYLFGGYDVNGTVYDQVYTYTPGDKEWVELETKMPIPLARGGIATNGKEILIVGGDTNRINENGTTTRVTVNKTFLYYPATDTWKDLSQTIYAPHGKSYLTPMAYVDGLYIKADAYKGRRMEILQDAKDYSNEPPAAQNDSTVTEEDHSVTISVLENDNDANGDSLSIEVAARAEHGELEVSGMQVVYTPDSNYHGEDSFTYQITDGFGGTSEASVSITVTAVNDAPVAEDDNVTLEQDSNITIHVLANDSDVDSDVLSVVIVGHPEHGSAEIKENSILYTPESGYVGTDTITYQAKDPSGTLSGSATVQIKINNVDQEGEGAGTSSGSGGGCTYNPHAKGFDLMLLLMILLSLYYPIKRKLYSHRAPKRF